MIKDMLVNKFIIAFNLAYSLKPPSVTVTDVEDPQKPTEILFVSLASRLAVLYYRQLCDYISGHNPCLRRADHREAIRELLKVKNYNSVYFKLFERSESSYGHNHSGLRYYDASIWVFRKLSS